MHDQQQSDSARATLDGARERERAAARRVQPPWWHDPVIGLLLAVVVSHHAFPVSFGLFMVGGGLLGILLVLRHYKNQDAWVDGWREGRTYPYSIAFVVAYLIIYFGSMALYHQADMVWAVPAAAFAVFLLTIVFGRVWMAVWRREISESR